MCDVPNIKGPSDFVEFYYRLFIYYKFIGQDVLNKK